MMHDLRFRRSAAQAFLGRMIWRTGNRPEPIIALLGPPGSGRSTVLDELSRECGQFVVHAKLDFGRSEMDSAAAVAVTAFEMARGWGNLRRDVTFYRVGLCLLALNEQLDSNRGAARTQIKNLIKQFVRNTPEGRAGFSAENAVDVVVDVVGRLVTAENAAAIDLARGYARPVIHSLLQTAGRWRVRNALRWFTTLPELESADVVDSLISISRSPRSEVPDRLMSALLADIDDNVRHNSPIRSDCDCDDRGKHDHAWVLLVDNAGTPGGQRFLTDLAAVRARWSGSSAEPTRIDPLLVVGATSSWRPEWNPWWTPPWQSEAFPNQRQRGIPLFSRATHEGWAKPNADGVREGDITAAWYPVWMDPLEREQTDKLVSSVQSHWRDKKLAGFAHRLAAGHPGAVCQLRDRTSAETVATRRKLLLSDGDGRGTPLWEEVTRALQSVRPYRERPGADIPGVMVAAAYCSDPWGQEDQSSPEGFPDLSQTFAALQENLWISTFAPPSELRKVTHGDRPPRPVLHPWLARCLLAGLAIKTATGDDPDDLTDPWDQLFSRLRAAVAGKDASQKRNLFYDLALGHFAPVAFSLAERFNKVGHRHWITDLDNVTSAPSKQLLFSDEEDCYTGLLDSYEELLDSKQEERTPVRMFVATLVAARWLHRDPLVSNTTRWKSEIYGAFDSLQHNSTRPGDTALQEAAACFK